MLYKPKFCCNCGEQVQRTEWKLLTSRRFCEFCETEYKSADYVPRALVIAGLVLSVFGLRAIIVQPSVSTPAAAERPNKATLKPAALSPRPAQPESTDPGTPATVSKTTEQPANAARPSEQPVYFCGAPTKKGTPCSRRVKTKGVRCWQHGGKSE